MRSHIDIVAALQIGFGILGILFGGVAFLVLLTIGAAAGEEEAFFVLSGIGLVVGLAVFLLSVPAIIGGIGLLKRKNWARILVLIVSAIDLINFPIGTALGVYSIVVLIHEDTIEAFASKAT